MGVPASIAPTMTRLADGLFRVLKVAMVAFLALMVALVFGNVVLRYGFNKGITISEEMSRMLFVWLTFTSAVVAMRENAHLGIDSLVKHLPPAGKKACFLATHVLILIICLLFLQGSWKQTIISHDVGAIAPVTGMSMVMFYGTGVVFSVLASLLTIADIGRLLAGRLGDDELVTVKETTEEVEMVGDPDPTGREGKSVPRERPR